MRLVVLLAACGALAAASCPAIAAEVLVATPSELFAALNDTTGSTDLHIITLTGK